MSCQMLLQVGSSLNKPNRNAGGNQGFFLINCKYDSSRRSVFRRVPSISIYNDMDSASPLPFNINCILNIAFSLSRLSKTCFFSPSKHPYSLAKVLNHLRHKWQPAESPLRGEGFSNLQCPFHLDPVISSQSDISSAHNVVH